MFINESKIHKIVDRCFPKNVKASSMSSCDKPLFYPYPLGHDQKKKKIKWEYVCSLISVHQPLLVHINNSNSQADKMKLLLHESILGLFIKLRVKAKTQYFVWVLYATNGYKE